MNGSGAILRLCKFPRKSYVSSEDSLVPIDIRKQAQKLRRLLKKYSKSYYNESKSIISDREYDELFGELQRIESRFPSLGRASSPTKSVGVHPSSANGKMITYHKIPMLSLSSIHSYDEAVEFDAKLSELLKVPNFSLCYVAELKYDGVALSLNYRDGVLSQVLTRGTGKVGEDITDAATKFLEIPMELELGNEDFTHVEIRGEAFMSKAAFLNENGMVCGDDTPEGYPSLRSLTSGLLLRTRNFSKTKLKFVAYNYFGKKKFERHSDMLEHLGRLGFSNGMPYVRILNGIGEFESLIEQWSSLRNSFEFDVDGIVLKVNDMSYSKILGCTSRSPRFSIAYKFSSLQTTSTIKDIKINVGRTGRITPVAIIEPVKLGGITISRATLHNRDFVEKKHIGIGSRVLVERSGDVIPQIVGTLLETTNQSKSHIPSIDWSKCPCPLNTPLSQSNGNTTCEFISCPLQNYRRLVHFCKTLKIQGLGESTIRELMEFGLVNSIGDIFRLSNHTSVLKRKHGWGDKKVDNLVARIRDTVENTSFDQVIAALGIVNVGEETSRKLAVHFGSMDALQAASREELARIDDVGEILTKSIFEFFLQNKSMIEELKFFGLKMSVKAEEVKDVLKGKSFMMTGTFSVSKSELERFIVQNGGIVMRTNNASVSYLLKGFSKSKNFSSKEKFCNENGIPILFESDLYEMVGE